MPNPKDIPVTTVAKIDEIRLATAAELFLALNAVKKHERKTIFRGQRDAAHELIPTAWRSPILMRLREQIKKEKSFEKWQATFNGGRMCDTDTLIDKYAIRNSDGSARLEEVASWLFAEHRIIEQFCNACDRVALGIGG